MVVLLPQNLPSSSTRAPAPASRQLFLTEAPPKTVPKPGDRTQPVRPTGRGAEAVASSLSCVSGWPLCPSSRRMTSEEEDRCPGTYRVGARKKTEQDDAPHSDAARSPQAASSVPRTGGPPVCKDRGTPITQASGVHRPGQEELVSGRGSPCSLSLREGMH